MIYMAHLVLLLYPCSGVVFGKSIYVMSVVFYFHVTVHCNKLLLNKTSRHSALVYVIKLA
jgi:hypothetical protein